MSINLKNKKSLLGRTAIFGTALIWGTSFVVLKNTLNNVPTFYILAFRFTGAAVILALLGNRAMRKTDKGYLIGGGVMGVFLFVAYAIQTFGLVYTTPGKSAFLTAVYCVMVPFIHWGISRKKPAAHSILAALLCFCGVALSALRENMSMGVGDTLTIVSALFFSLHIICTSNYVKNRDPVPLVVIQFIVVAVLSWIFAAATEEFPTRIPGSTLLGLAYLSAICTGGCFYFQTYGQKYTPPASAAVILAMEAVFGALASILFYEERLVPREVLGFLLIFVAIVWSETKFTFLAPLAQKIRSAVEKKAERRIL